MRAIGIESRETQLVSRRRPGKLDDVLRALMGHHELASGMHRRQTDDQRRDHAIKLFAIAVRQKEIALFVDEQLVEMRCELASAQAQCLSYPLGDVQEQRIPFRIGELKLRGIEFPHPPHVGVNQGFRALAIRGLVAQVNELMGLRLAQRQPHCA